MKGLAQIIVDNRKYIFVFYIVAIVFSLLSMHWVQVEEDITFYLAKDSLTRRGITVMNEEFVTPAMADIMISNISFAHAQRIKEQMEEVSGVASVMFENNGDHYRNSAALFIILFEGEANEESALEGLAALEKIVKPYDSSIATDVGFDQMAQLTKDMTIVGVLGVVIAILVLLFTSQSYAEIPILLATFAVAALLNLGTNFMLGKISFISNSVGVVLQLALAIDYAIILCHRFNEEYEKLPAGEAAIAALSKAIPEISSSSLTTVGGLAALAFMQFGVGKDLAAVMIKAIFWSMFSVFTLMPGLLVLFSRAIKKTAHRNFVPSVNTLGRFAIKSRYVVLPVFLILLAASFIFSSKCPFLFGIDEILPHRLNAQQRAQERIKDNFGSNNMAALIVPGHNYRLQKRLLTTLNSFPEVETAVGLANTEAMGGYMLADYLTPREFAELLDLDYDLVQILYSAYAIKEEEYGQALGGIGHYGVPLIDMVEFLIDQAGEGILPANDMMSDLDEYGNLLSMARLQMESENYSRIMLYLNLPEESPETFNFLGTIYEECEKYYGNEPIYVVGGSTNALDLSLTFNKDNLIISILSVLFVVIILTFTFNSLALAALLISVIQASIWVNFSFPYLKNEGIYFLGFLLVSSIQMGANIDYAIVITSRYLSLKDEMSPQDAVVAALNQGFPTVITSGTILAVAGLLIGFISTDGATSVLGTYLGQGTIISIFLVLFVLPQLLYFGRRLVERTTFTIKWPFTGKEDAAEAHAQHGTQVIQPGVGKDA